MKSKALQEIISLHRKMITTYQHSAINTNILVRRLVDLYRNKSTKVYWIQFTIRIESLNETMISIYAWVEWSLRNIMRRAIENMLTSLYSYQIAIVSKEENKFGSQPMAWPLSIIVRQALIYFLLLVGQLLHKCLVTNLKTWCYITLIYITNFKITAKHTHSVARKTRKAQTFILRLRI